VADKNEKPKNAVKRQMFQVELNRFVSSLTPSFTQCYANPTVLLCCMERGSISFSVLGS